MLASKRIFVITDIHGCNYTFRELLFRNICLDKTDILYLLGDYIDRGPDSKGVLDTITTLINDGYDVRPILGNHEDMLLQVIRTRDYCDLEMWLENGGVETLQSFGVATLDDIPEKYLEFLSSLPYFRISESHVFVHAGLDVTLDDPLSKEGSTAMLWSRDVEERPEMIGGRTLVAGHTIMDIDEIRNSLNTKLIQLDNGCFMGFLMENRGSLVALELISGVLYVQKNIEGS